MHAGRSYAHRIPAAEAHLWLLDLRKAVKNAQLVEAKKWIMEMHGGSKLPFLRARALLIYESMQFQALVCGLVVMGFGLDIYEAQVLPPPDDPLNETFFYADAFLTIFFLVEVRCVDAGVCKARKSARGHTRWVWHR